MSSPSETIERAARAATTDYRSLLKTYIRHVADQEGVSFLEDGYDSPRKSETPTVSPEEWALLQELDREVEAEDREAP